MKNLLIAASILLFAMLFASCEDSTTEPTNDIGSLFIQSTPAGAQIWIDDQNKNKVTPDSIPDLIAGQHKVTLKLTGYSDTTLFVNVVKNTKTPVLVTLKSTMVTQSFGPVQVWEIIGTSASQPSGLDLSSGIAYGVSSTDKDKVDIFYFTTYSPNFIGEIRSADRYSGLTRKSFFKVGTTSNLNDGLDSPTKDNSWASFMPERDTTKYYFVFDADSNYSKVKIANFGGTGATGDPNYVRFQWIYNKTKNDVRF